MELSDRVSESWLRYERDARANKEAESGEANKTCDVRDAAKRETAVDSFVRKHGSVTYAIYIEPWPQVP